MKFEVVGDDTSSLASLRKLLTLILSGIIVILVNPSHLRTHLGNIFVANFYSFPSEKRSTFPANYAISAQDLGDDTPTFTGPAASIT